MIFEHFPPSKDAGDRRKWTEEADHGQGESDVKISTKSHGLACKAEALKGLHESATLGRRDVGPCIKQTGGELPDEP